MKLLVLDGNSIVNRAYYGIKLLTTKEGLYTNALYGFLNMLNRLLEETQPDSVAVAFDLRAPTFRHKAYDGYKATRKGMPEELASQMPVLKEMLVMLGYKIVECEGYEADDILGTLAKYCENNGHECVIATGDRDSLQLVGDKVTVRLAATKMGRPEVTLYDRQRIKEDYGVEPSQLIDIKAIQGDSSDNIPGVAGIGQKGAGELIVKYHDLEYIYEHLDELDIKPGMKQKLADSKETAFLSKYLGTICCEAPVEADPALYVPSEPDRQGLARLFTRLEFFNYLNKMGLQVAEEEKAGEPAAEFTLTRTDTLPAWSGEVCFLWEEDRLYLAAEQTVYLLEPKEEQLRSFFESQVSKATFDCKAAYRRLLEMGLPLCPVDFDAMLAAYLLNPSVSRYDLQHMAMEYQIPVPALEDETAQKCALLSLLLPRLKADLEEKELNYLFSEVEMPLAEVLADMEHTGIALDVEGVEAFGSVLGEEIAQLEQRIYELAGKPFNINSPKQLGQLLFDEMGLKGGKKTKTGYSTNVEVLEGLRHEHPIIEEILKYRTLAKLKSTYTDGLVKVVGEDGRVHTSFNQTETRTGRISSTEPNMQNIPVRTELGRELRRFFTAGRGCTLCDADYSQIELRVLAHMAKDKNMIDTFNSNGDIHKTTAAQVFHMPEIMVTPQMRSRAKAVNFGIVYGIGAFSLSKDIGVTRKEAQTYIDEYLKNYSGVKKFMDDSVAAAKERGFASTLFHRRRYLPELTSSNHNLRAFGERVAMNMPIQGTAADIIKIAMVRVYRRLKRENLKSRLILQVHDELIVEAPLEEQQAASEILQYEMEHAADMAVTLEADVHWGENWFIAKG